MKIKTLIWTIGILCCVSWGNAQGFTVTAAANGTTPNALIQQHLAGEGVILSNGSFTYGANTTTTSSISSNPQIGVFNRGNVTFPISSGIVMTTSNLSSISQSSNYPSANASVDVTNNTVTPDAKLATIISANLHDRAALDFDFVAFSDTMAFNYVFASEEYPDFVCSDYNDVFGFFIEGYNPVTHANSSWNIALLPNGITPVTINTVNGGQYGSSYSPTSTTVLTNSQYYHQNSSSPPAFNGYTVKLAASANVVPCQVYHMHLAIADVTDGVYDSGVFLEEGSFYSPSVELEREYSTANQVEMMNHYGDTLIQGCRDVEVQYKLPGGRIAPGSYYTWVEEIGTTVMGQDYDLTYFDGTIWRHLNPIQPEIFFSSSDSVTRIHLTMLDSVLCDDDEVKEVRLIFHTVFCDLFIDQGAGRDDTLVFHLKCNPAIELADTTLYFCHEANYVTVEQLSGSDDVLFHWLAADGSANPAGIANPNAQTSEANITQNRTYRVAATDRYGCLSDTATVEVFVSEKPEVDLQIAPETGCTPLPVVLQNLNSPDGCQFRWRVVSDNGNYDTLATVNPLNLVMDSAGYYNVSLWLSTAPGCDDSLSMTHAIHVSEYPHAIPTFSPEEPHNGETVYFYNESTGDEIVSYLWTFGDGATATSADAEHAYHVSTSDNKLVRFSVTNVDGCSDDTTFIVPVVDNFAFYVPNSFTPNGDNINDVFQPKATDVAYYRLELYDRQGNLFFMTEDTEDSWDGTIGGQPAPVGVYVWKVEYIRVADLNTTHHKQGTVTLVR